MKYHGFFFWVCRGTIRQVLTEKYGGQYAAELLRRSRTTYRRLVEQADDIGRGNHGIRGSLFFGSDRIAQ